MATSSRLKGKSGVVFTMKKGAAAAIPYGDDVKKWELTFEEKDDDDLTFAEAMAGIGSDATLNLTAISSFDAGALFAFLYDNPGIDVVVTLGPWGNAVPSATKPHFTGTASTGLQPPLQNEAGTSEKGADFEKEIKFSTPLTKLTS